MVQATDFQMITDVGTSAETIGAGNVEGFNYFASTVFENPAGLYRISNQSVSFFTTKVMNEVTYSNVAYSIKTQKGVFGFGYMQATVYDASSTKIDDGSLDEEIITNGTYDYHNALYKFSYSKSFKEKIHFGISTTLYDVNLDNIRGQGYDLDSGLIVKNDKFEYSIFGRNLIPFRRIKYSDEITERLPFHLLGGVKFPIKSCEVMPQIRYQQRNVLPSVGVVYKPSKLPFVNFTSGYKQYLTATNKNKQNLTFGIGLNLYDVYFNYAYEKSDYIPQDNKSYFSMSVLF